MLISEYNYEMDIAVQRAEEREIAFAEGIEQGKSLGLAEGVYQKTIETARLMKQSDCTLDFIAKITGLTKSEIESL